MGVLVIIVFALGAVLWHLSAIDRSPALAVAAGVDRGDVISAEDVDVVYVPSDSSIARLDESQLDQVVGRIALIELAPGTLLNRSVVADRPSLTDGQGVVGLSLEPGGYPAIGLAPGDRVNVVQTTDPAAEGGEADEGADAVIARGATVFAVEELPSDRRLVSILTAEPDADAVAAAAGSGSLRLVLVS